MAIKRNPLWTHRTDLDAFSRLRVSEPHTLFSGLQTFDNLPLVYDEATTGTGTSAHDADRASVTLSVTDGGVGSCVRQTKQYFSYRAGNSQLAMMTFVMGAAATDTTKRIGLFDANNGVFFEQTSSGLAIVLRSYVSGAPVDTSVAQADWNLDTFDSTANQSTESAPSSVSLDVTKAQILIIDLQYLGVGRVRVGFDVDGDIFYAHEFLNANTQTAVYMSTGKLPIRAEITSTSAVNASLEHMCATVMREGAPEAVGYEVSVDTGAALVTNTTTLTSLLAVRLKSAYIRATIFPRDIHILNTGSYPMRWLLCLNPTLSGAITYDGTTPTGLAGEYGTTARTVTPTVVLGSGFVAAGQGAGISRSTSSESAFAQPLAVAADIAGTSDQLVLACQGIGGSNDIGCAMSFIEVL